MGARTRLLPRRFLQCRAGWTAPAGVVRRGALDAFARARRNATPPGGLGAVVRNVRERIRVAPRKGNSTGDHRSILLPADAAGAAGLLAEPARVGADAGI